MKVRIEATAFRVNANTEEEAKAIVYDFCKNHDFLVVEKIFSEVEDEKEVAE